MPDADDVTNNEEISRNNVGLLSTDDVRTGMIQGITFTKRAVQYSVVDGRAIFEGDIVLGTVEELEQDTAAIAADPAHLGERGVGVSGKSHRWPGGVMPFTIDPALPNQRRVRDAIDDWQRVTRMRFVERVAANASAFPDFVAVLPSTREDECFSAIGRRGGRQELRLGSSCDKAVAIHEFGHAWGLWHEQSREDRDSAAWSVNAPVPRRWDGWQCPHCRNTATPLATASTTSRSRPTSALGP